MTARSWERALGIDALMVVRLVGVQEELWNGGADGWSALGVRTRPPL